MESSVVKRSPGRLIRRTSASDVSTCGLSLPRRASTTSLRTLESLGSPSIEEDTKGHRNSWTLKGSVKKKLSSFFEGDSSGPNSKMGSMSSLLNTPVRRSKEPEEEEEVHKKSVKKRMSRRFSALFDVKSPEKDPTENAETTVNAMNFPEPEPQRRLMKRGDLPVCWTDYTSTNTPKHIQTNDILTKLASSLFSRHLVRHILQMLSTQVIFLHFSHVSLGPGIAIMCLLGLASLPEKGISAVTGSLCAEGRS